MRGEGYDKWVKSIKEGDVVLLMDNYSQYSCPVIFSCWHGKSEINGYRSQYLYLPEDQSRYNNKTIPYLPHEIDEIWSNKMKTLKSLGGNGLRLGCVIAHAEKRYFPCPKEFLSKNQIKYINLVKKLKGYEH